LINFGEDKFVRCPHRQALTMTSKVMVILSNSTFPRHLASAKRHGVALILLPLAVTLFASLRFAVCVVSMAPLQRTRLDGAIKTGGSRNLGSRIPMQESKSQSQTSVDTHEILRISKTVKPGRMAQVIKDGFVKRNDEVVYGRVAGANASFVAVQSVVIANLELEKVQHKLAPEHVGKVMVFAPQPAIVMEEGKKVNMWEMHFQLVQFGKVPSDGSSEEALVVHRKTNSGKLAGAMLAHISQQSKAVLRFFGHQALWHAIAATTIAQDMLDTNETESGSLAIYPAWYTDKEKNNRGIELRCFKM